MRLELDSITFFLDHLQNVIVHNYMFDVAMHSFGKRSVSSV